MSQQGGWNEDDAPLVCDEAKEKRRRGRGDDDNSGSNTSSTATEHTSDEEFLAPNDSGLNVPPSSTVMRDAAKDRPMRRAAALFDGTIFRAKLRARRSTSTFVPLDRASRPTMRRRKGHRPERPRPRVHFVDDVDENTPGGAETPGPTSAPVPPQQDASAPAVPNT